jgi:membrane protein DedA with SNARE-associated domain
MLNIMPPELIIFIAHYGYFAIFLLIFSQEIGIPNPVPNELVLMFSGYLTIKGILFLPIVILVAVSADFIGTNILYIIFYFFGTYIIQHKPRWVPISHNTINKLSERISTGGRWTIYVGRLTPFIRGYTSVITGLLQIKPRVFLPIALISATIWSAVCVITGRILSSYLNYAGNKMGNVQFILLIIAVLLILVIIATIKYFQKRSVIKRK